TGRDSRGLVLVAEAGSRTVAPRAPPPDNPVTAGVERLAEALYELDGVSAKPILGAVRLEGLPASGTGDSVHRDTSEATASSLAEAVQSSEASSLSFSSIIFPL